MSFFSLIAKIFVSLFALWLFKAYGVVLSMYWRMFIDTGSIPMIFSGGLFSIPFYREKKTLIMERVWSRKYGENYVRAFQRTGASEIKGLEKPSTLKPLDNLYAMPVVGFSSRWFSHSLVLTKREDIKYVLTHTKTFVKLPLLNDILKIMLGNGLVLSSGAIWKRQRRLLQPLFHAKRVRESMSLIGEQMQRSIAELDSQVAAKSASALDPVPFFEKMTLRAIVAFAFGDLPNVDKLGDLWHEATRAFQGYVLFRLMLGEISDSLTFIPAVAAMRRSCNELRTIVRQILVDRREKRRESASVQGEVVPPSDLIGHMLALEEKDPEEKIDDELMIDEALTVFLAGHETSSNTSAWACFFMAHRPDIQQKVREEAQALLAKHPEAATTAHIENQEELLPWARAVVKEALRLRPPAALLGRQVTEPCSLPNSKVQLKPGDVVNCSIHLLQTDVENWERPLEFLPERFIAEDQGLAKHDQFSWLPFSLGARNCAGKALGVQETCAIISTMAARYRWTLDKSDKTEMEEVFTLLPVGTRLSFSKV